MRLLLASCLVVALAACAKPCGPTNCSGCCDSTGTCVTPSDTHCGVGGAACVACAIGMQCIGTVCQFPSSNGSGNGSSSSGSSGSAASSGSSGATSGSAGSSGAGTHGSGSSGSGAGSSGSTGAAGSTGSTGVVLPPNVMFVVDRSGSMAEPASGSGTGCQNSAGTYTGNRADDCKWNNLLDALTGPASGGTGFVAELAAQLASGSQQARMGLVTFSGSGATATCAVGVVQVAIPSSDTDTSSQIDSALLATTPIGATPTAATMTVVGSSFPPPEVGRRNYAILVTDGAPNCDASINPTQTNCGGDRCTNSCANISWSNCACNPAVGSTTAPLLCLDDDALVAAVTNLEQSQGVQTFVIGFGADTSTGIVHDTLNRVAVAGGVPNTATPGFSYYQASSFSELSSALTSILQKMRSP